jgi:hypothetical protein
MTAKNKDKMRFKQYAAFATEETITEQIADLASGELDMLIVEHGIPLPRELPDMVKMVGKPEDGPGVVLMSEHSRQTDQKAAMATAEDLKARVAKLEAKFLAVMEALRREDPERFKKIAPDMIAKVEAFRVKAKGRR